MDESDVGRASRRKKSVRLQISDSDESDHDHSTVESDESELEDSTDQTKPSRSLGSDIVIPASDCEDSSEADTSSDFVPASPNASKQSSAKPLRNNLLRKSFGFRTSTCNESSDSLYLSFQETADLPLTPVHNRQISVEHLDSFENNGSISADENTETMSNEQSNYTHADLTSSPVHKQVSFTEQHHSSENDISISADANIETVSNEQLNYSLAELTLSPVHGQEIIREQNNSLENDYSCSAYRSNESMSNEESNYSSSIENGSKASQLETPDLICMDVVKKKTDQRQSGLENLNNNMDSKYSEFLNSDAETDVDSTHMSPPDTINWNDKRDLSPAPISTPKKPTVVNLVESDSSLQNSPVGATRKPFEDQRNLTDIVAELSSVSNDVMVKQTLLDTINVNTLPDNGRNLLAKLAELQKRKFDLENELQNNEEYRIQELGFQQIQGRTQESAKKQTTLNFPKVSPKFESDFGNSRPTANGINLNATRIPDWGELPQPTGFGNKAMQRHLNEKSLTLEALSSLHKALKTCPSEDTYAEDPKHLKVELMPHQKHGLAWMLWREQEKPAGGILADDMGLGKTLSMISLILKSEEMKEESEKSGSESDSDDESPSWLKSKHSRLPYGGTLVVCPASLMAQWEREIYKRVKSNRLSVGFYHGPKRETKPRRLAKYDVVITTYNLISRESGVDTAKNATTIKDKGPLFMIKWNRIILDEAHIVRNHKSQMALGVCELIGKKRWCLTGTPIQNKELDLYALLKFLRCSPFDDLAVWKRWVDNKNAAGMQRLSTMMKSLMLRRTKEQLQKQGDLNCLPEKNMEIIDVHLDPEELAIYEKVAIFSSTLFAQFLVQRSEKQQALDAKYGVSSKPVWEQAGGPGPDNQYITTDELAAMHRKMKGITEVKTHQILVLLLRLRQICCHPGLVKKMVEDGDLDVGGVEDKSGLDVDLFNQMNNLNIHESDLESEPDNSAEDLNKSHTEVLSVDNPVLSLDRPSAKIRAVLDLIQEKISDGEDKAIIVSQWTSMLDILATFLKQMKIKFERLSGEVPVDKRQEIVNAFNKKLSGPQVLLLSLTAGGVGLNLVGANHLMLVDIHWNPQLEAQACDRIYRVGQKKDVFIYRFITVDTIEERIKKLQDHKLALADSVLTGSKNTQASKLTLDDLKMLFSVPKPIQPAAAEPAVPFELDF